jgi:anti-sigma factor RsiW
MSHLTAETLNLYLDGALDPRERAVADAHLDMCEACRAELSALRELFATIEMLLADPLPADLTARVLEQIAFAPESGTENSEPGAREQGIKHERYAPSTNAAGKRRWATNYRLWATDRGQSLRPTLVVAALATQVALATALAVWLAPQLADVATASLGALRLPTPAGLGSIIAGLNSWLVAAGLALPQLVDAGDMLSIGPFGELTIAQWSMLLIGVGVVWFFGNRLLLAGSIERRGNHQEAA